jgi:hypothetical protein
LQLRDRSLLYLEPASQDSSGHLPSLANQRLFNLPKGIVMRELALVICIVFAATSCRSSSTAGSSTPSAVSAMNDTDTIDAYVSAVKARLATDLTRREVALAPDAFSGISTAQWTKLHVYSDGTEVLRVKLYPADAAKKPEAFYFRNGTLVMVSIEATTSADDEARSGGDERWYFDGSLHAIRASDGSSQDVSLAAAKEQGAKLLQEAERVLKLAAS